MSYTFHLLSAMLTCCISVSSFQLVLLFVPFTLPNDKYFNPRLCPPASNVTVVEFHEQPRSLCPASILRLWIGLTSL